MPRKRSAGFTVAFEAIVASQVQNCKFRNGCLLDDGVVVGPGGFEAVRQLFYGLDAVALPHEEAYECCCQTACHPN